MRSRPRQRLSTSTAGPWASSSRAYPGCLTLSLTIALSLRLSLTPTLTLRLTLTLSLRLTVALRLSLTLSLTQMPKEAVGVRLEGQGRTLHYLPSQLLRLPAPPIAGVSLLGFGLGLTEGSGEGLGLGLTVT